MRPTSFSSGGFAITKDERGSLRLAHSRARAVRRAILMTLFFLAWYWLLFGKPTSLDELILGVRDKLQSDWSSWVPVLVPLILLRMYVLSLRTALVGITFEFDRGSGIIRRGSKYLARFGDVRSVRLHTISGESRTEYLLCLQLKDQREVRLVSDRNRDRMVAATNELAETLEVDAVKNGR